MANKKITDLTELSTPADGDWCYLVDISDTTDSAAGTSFKVQASNLRGYPQTAAEATAGATPTALQYRPGHVTRYGATGDGSTDDTAAIQAALDAASEAKGQCYIPNGTYIINSDANTYLGEKFGLRVKSNTDVYFEPGATLKSEDNNATHYAVLAVFGANDVLIHGKGIIDGARDTHTDAGGEWGHCLDIKNCNRVIVRDVHCKNGWGDGVYIGETTTTGVQCTEIYLSNVRASNNRRNNCSVVSVDVGGMTDCVFDNANGTNPQSGVDIEPNAGAAVNHFTLTGCAATNNTRDGFVLSGAAVSPTNIALANCIAESNSWSGFRLANADFVNLSNCQAISNTLDGIRLDTSDDNIVNGCIVKSNTENGIQVLTSRNCVVSDNSVTLNGEHGIFVDNVSPNTAVTGNSVFENSQTTDVTYDNIIIDRNCDECSIVGNNIDAGILTNKPRYGVNINVNTVNNTVISGNQNEGGGSTADWNDAGTGTMFSGNLSVNDVATATADDTTPTVKNLRILKLPANTGATAITALDDGAAGQVVTLRMDSNTNSATIADSGNFSLSAAWSPDLNDTITLITTDGSVWQEISRSTN